MKQKRKLLFSIPNIHIRLLYMINSILLHYLFVLIISIVRYNKLNTFILCFPCYCTKKVRKTVTIMYVIYINWSHSIIFINA